MDKPAGQPSTVTWGPLAAVLVTVGIYFASQVAAGFVIGLVGYLVGGMLGYSTWQIEDWLVKTPEAQFIFVLAIQALILWLLWQFLRRRRADFRTLGLVRPRLRDAFQAALGFGAYVVLYVTAASVIQRLIPRINFDQEQELGFDNAHTPLQLVMVFVSLVVLPPLVEELLMRGFLYKGLKNGLRRGWAVLVTSALFAIAHLQFGSGSALLWAAAIDTFVLSLVLIYLVEKSSSLWPAIGVHAIKNAFAFLFLFVLA